MLRIGSQWYGNTNSPTPCLLRSIKDFSVPRVKFYNKIKHGEQRAFVVQIFIDPKSSYRYLFEGVCLKEETNDDQLRTDYGLLKHVFYINRPIKNNPIKVIGLFSRKAFKEHHSRISRSILTN